MYEVPKSKGVEPDQRFTFTIEGNPISVPFIQYAPAGAVEHFENGREITGLIACCDTDAAKDAVRGLDGPTLRDLFDAWKDASTVTPGESEPSGS